MEEGVSIVIPYHNEGKGFILETVDQIENTIDIDNYEIIIVDDCSSTPLRMSDVTVLRHPKNKGVGASFDTGVSAARYDNIFLSGSDIRFVKNEWASRMLAEIRKHPSSLICTSVVSLYASNPQITFEASRRLYRYNGATLLLMHGHSDSPDRPEQFHSILNAQWLPREYVPLMRPEDILQGNDAFANYLDGEHGVKLNRSESYEVPCILGAFYGTTKSWYKYIDGFWGHRQWGSLEPYISLKSHFFGGKCLTNPLIETGHIFKETGTHDTDLSNLFYNKMLITHLLFEDCDRDKLLNWLPENEHMPQARETLKEMMPDIIAKKIEYKLKMRMTVEELVNKFNLNF